MQETQEMCVWSLGWEDPLEESMATHSSIPAWRIPWREEPGGQSIESQTVQHNREREHTRKRKCVWCKCHVPGSQSPQWWGKFRAVSTSKPGNGEWPTLALPLPASVYPSVTAGVGVFYLWLWWSVILWKWQPCFYSAHVKDPLNDLWPKSLFSLCGLIFRHLSVWL